MPRMRLSLVAAPEDDAPATDPPADAAPAAGADTFHAILAVEDVWTGDGRYFEPNSFVWRNLPLPMMADDENNPAHLESKLIGNILSIMRIGNEIHADGEYVKVPDPNSDDGKRALHLQGLMKAGNLKGVSVDLDDPDFTVEIPIEPMDDAETASEADAADGADDNIITIEVNRDTMPREIWHSARIMGATALPFPALQEAQMEPAAVAASAGYTGMVTDAVVAAVGVTPPLLPPFGWFENPVLDGPTALTVTDDGRVYGHVADLSSCHIGFQDRCVQPPLSQTDYAWFNLGEVLCEGGERVSAGVLTMDTGHAPMNASVQEALAHYDNTGTAIADVVAGEDEYGIWVAGAIRPDVRPEKVRAFMAAKPSGDWRRVRGNLEMCAVLMVNVPGFPVPRLRAKMTEGVTASLVASLPFVPRKTDVAHHPAARPAGYQTAVAALAKSIGADRASRVRRLREGMK